MKTIEIGKTLYAKLHCHNSKMKCLISVFGDDGVGKSSITQQFIQGRFIDDYNPTIEDVYEKHTTIDGTDYRVDVLDTAGCEEISDLIRSGWYDGFIRDSGGFLFVYDITRRASFEGAEYRHAFVLRQRRAPPSEHIPMILCGNKCDLVAQRQVQSEEGEKLAKRLGCRFIEVSARTGTNINEAFISLISEICGILPNDNREVEKRKRKNNNTCIIC